MGRQFLYLLRPAADIKKQKEPAIFLKIGEDYEGWTFSELTKDGKSAILVNIDKRITLNMNDDTKSSS